MDEKLHNRDVCESEGGCSHDGFLELIPRVCMSIYPEGKSCSGPPFSITPLP
jgi:hypothetical protein